MTDATILGLRLYEFLTLLGIIIGPIVAVLITLWIDGRRKDRDQKLTILRMLLATRHVPADPSFQLAINLIPVEFGRDREVINSYKEFIAAINVVPNGVNDSKISLNTETKTVRLIFEIARSLGYGIRETDLQTTAYASSGWVERERINIDSQKAMRDIASILWIQTRLAAGESWEQINASPSSDQPTSSPELERKRASG